MEHVQARLIAPRPCAMRCTVSVQVHIGCCEIDEAQGLGLEHSDPSARVSPPAGAAEVIEFTGCWRSGRVPSNECKT